MFDGRLEAGGIAVPAGAATLGVRPEGLLATADDALMSGDVVLREALGAETVIITDLRDPAVSPAPRLTLRIAGDNGPDEGHRIGINIDPARLCWFDSDGRALASA